MEDFNESKFLNRFAGATGKLSLIGVLDTSQGKIVLRYQGTVCFVQPEH